MSSGKAKAFIEKLRQLPDAKKKIVFFTVVGISIVILCIFGFIITKNDITKAQQSLHSVNLPHIEIPKDVSDRFSEVQDMANKAKQALTDNSLQTADWKTYTNTKYHFEIKYPGNMLFTEPVGPNFYVRFGSSADNHLKESLSIVIVTTKNSNTQTIDNKIAGNDVIEEKNIGGSVGKVTIYGSSECQKTVVYQKELSYVFIDNCQENKDMFNVMLSTFKFTDQ